MAKDEKKAFEWYTKSAEQGDVLAKAVNNMVNATSHQSHTRAIHSNRHDNDVLINTNSPKIHNNGINPLNVWVYGGGRGWPSKTCALPFLKVTPQRDKCRLSGEEFKSRQPDE